MNRCSLIVFGLLLFASMSGGCAGCSPRSAEVPRAAAPASPASIVANETAVPDATANARALSATVLPQFSKIPAGKDGTLNVLLKLAGGAVANAVRKSLDIAVVIDTSGSMSGEKMDSVKIAVLELLKQLTPGDRVTLITYANNVQTLEVRVQTDTAGISTLRNRVLGITPGGGTALGPALLTGLSLLESGLETSRITHLLLLSDGLANIGERRTETLGAATASAFRRGISVSTLGVGLDYNEDLMTHVADQGGGQYHFIDDNQKTVAVLEDELKGLTAATAREIQVAITPEAGGAVDKVFGYPTFVEDGKTFIRVGTLRALQNRDIVFRLRYPADSASLRTLGTATIQYKNIQADDAGETLTAAVEMQSASDNAEAGKTENTEVTVRVAAVEGAAQLAMAARAVEDGNFFQAETLLDGSIAALKTQAARVPSKALDEQIFEMETAKSGITNAKSSASNQKYYVKKAKSSAYSKSKSVSVRKKSSSPTSAKTKTSK